MLQKIKKIFETLDDLPLWVVILLAIIVGMLIGTAAAFIEILINDVVDQVNFLRVMNRYFGN